MNTDIDKLDQILTVSPTLYRHVYKDRTAYDIHFHILHQIYQELRSSLPYNPFLNRYGNEFAFRLIKHILDLDNLKILVTTVLPFNIKIDDNFNLFSVRSSIEF